MSDSSEFITTIKQLMRLTREEKIDWKEQPPKNSENSSILEGDYDNLTFRVKEHPAAGTFALHDETSRTTLESVSPGHYVLEIHDQSDNSTVTSPPMKAVRDLVAVIRSRTQDDKLTEINRRLGAT